MFEDNIKPSSNLLKAAKSLGVGEIKRHVFLCLGPDCCSLDKGEVSWKHLKKRLKKLGKDADDVGIFRTKVGCLRVCADGPVMVVYPEGTWYHHMTPDRIDRVIDEHLLKGKPVLEYAFSVNPLNP